MATKPNDDSSLSHTRWNCKYHIVFIPKYRRKLSFNPSLFITIAIYYPLFKLGTKNIEILNNDFKKAYKN